MGRKSRFGQIMILSLYSLHKFYTMTFIFSLSRHSEAVYCVNLMVFISDFQISMLRGL